MNDGDGQHHRYIEVGNTPRNMVVQTVLRKVEKGEQRSGWKKGKESKFIEDFF